MTFIYNEVIQLSKTNEVLVLCQERKSVDKFPFESLRVLKLTPLAERIFWAMLRRLGWNKTYSASLSRQLESVIQTFSPDLIHAHFGGSGILMMDNIKTKQIPIFVHFHGFDASALLKLQHYRDRIKRLLSTKNVYPIFVSQYMRSKFDALDISIEKSSILYYGIDIKKFQRTSRPPKKPFIFLQVASFRDKKGQIYTIEAFAKLKAQLPDQAVRLVFVGDGETKDECESLVYDLGISSSVDFKGVLGGASIVEELNKAHCFVHHSITAGNGNQEGIPNAIMEAMAMELPVLSTYHAGIPELVEDGKHGYLVEEKDVNIYAERMKDILTWDYLPENRLKVKRQFEQERHANNLLDIYKDRLASA
ncbi:MAG: glycosyltransferase [Bacteroidota bacterium]